MSQEGQGHRRLKTELQSKNGLYAQAPCLALDRGNLRGSWSMSHQLTLTDTCWVTIIPESPHIKPGWHDLHTSTLNSSIVLQKLVLQ